MQFYPDHVIFQSWLPWGRKPRTHTRRTIVPKEKSSGRFLFHRLLEQLGKVIIAPSFLPLLQNANNPDSPRHEENGWVSSGQSTRKLEPGHNLGSLRKLREINLFLL